MNLSRNEDSLLCPSTPRYRIGAMVNEMQVEDLAWNNQNEYIFQITYEINPDDYDHLATDVKAFGVDTTEVLLQVIGMVIWAKEYHHLTGQMPNPYILVQLYSTAPSYNGWYASDEPGGGDRDFRVKS